MLKGDKMKKICITGHRTKELNNCMKYGDKSNSSYLNYINAQYISICNELLTDDCWFITGGAIGVDLDFAEVVIQYKQKLSLLTPNSKHKIFLEVAVPCKNQDKYFSPADKKRYLNVLNNADKVTYVGENYTNFCMQKRNEYMVNNSDKVYAFYNNTKKGGTYNTIMYAKRKHKQIEIIDLNNL